MLPLRRRGKHYCWTFPVVLLKVWRDSLRATLPTPRQAGSYRGERFSSMGDLHSKQPCIQIQDHSWSAELWRRRGRGNQSLSDTVRRQGLEREACDMRSFASLRVAVTRGGGGGGGGKEVTTTGRPVVRWWCITSFSDKLSLMTKSCFQ